MPARAAWPEKTITLVVPYAPGGTADALARLIAQHLGVRLGTSVAVLNKAGASGVIGQGAVATAAPDGYTVLYDATPFSINPHLQKLPFDPDKDLQPVTLVGVTPMLAVVPKSSPITSIQELLQAAQAGAGQDHLRLGRGRVPSNTWARRCSPRARASRCCTCRTRAAARRSWPSSAARSIWDSRTCRRSPVT